MALHTAARTPGSTREASRHGRLRWVVAGVAAVLVVVLAAVALGGPGGGSGTELEPSRSPEPGIVAEPAPVPAVPPPASTLPLSTTYTTVEGAPHDDQTGSTTDGIVVHPVRETPVHDAPDGRAIARMAPTQFGATWLPMIGEESGWVRVLLPSKPNGSTGWLRAEDVERAQSPYVVKVHLTAKRLELLRDGNLVGGWTVGTGKAAAPTPSGRTFLLGAFRDAKQSYSPVILPLGTHSPTHDTFGGGPGTVAIHTWPTDDGYGTASSDGCIRVPADALDQLTTVPLGTLVMIDED